MWGDQWLCGCGWENLCLRNRCRNCGEPRLEGDPIRPAMDVVTYSRP
jgi:hypothetical protein